MLRSLKQLLETEYEVVAMADNVISLLDALEVQPTPLVVLSASMALRETASLPRHLLRRYPALRIVVVDTETDPVCARVVLDAGCAAYVVAATAPDDLLHAAREAMQGRTYVSSSISSSGSTRDERESPSQSDRS